MFQGNAVTASDIAERGARMDRLIRVYFDGSISRRSTVQ